ncbi:squalene/phytoene synthase family protein [Methylocella sp.]|uniref:squalene/phytoene synthase family protein n=1 Tax=Methylocella sp. TaxID=1978226 RepID=UPI0037832BCB
MNAIEVEATKSERGENFPVASLLLAPERRAPILAYYRFARAADDVADDASLSPGEKILRLDAFEATLLGKSEAVEAAKPLRAALAADPTLEARHALDLLTAFRLDATKTRYADFAELMDYCAFSAAPVGRFVLNAHGVGEAVWPASDALCSALQIVNHMQDCGLDYRRIDRVYLPLDLLADCGATVGDLGAPKASPGLRAALLRLAEATDPLIALGSTLPPELAELRLRLEIGAIAALARRLNDILKRRDPLSEETHLSKPEALLVAGLGAARVLLRAPAAAPRTAQARGDAA